METHLDTARRVIRTEAAGLAALEAALTGPLAAPFDAALRLILDATGRVVGSVAHAPGARLGLVGGDHVTVSPGGEVRVFGPDLTERPR